MEIINGMLAIADRYISDHYSLASSFFCFNLALLVMREKNVVVSFSRSPTSLEVQYVKIDLRSCFLIVLCRFYVFWLLFIVKEGLVLIMISN